MKKYFIELFLFFSAIAAAYFMGWNNTDLIWSFWITSLVVGYVSIFRTSAAPFSLFNKNKLSLEDLKKFKELPITKKLLTILAVLIFVPTILFQIIFLSLHFCIFYLFAAYWLQELMPHSGITDILVDANGGGFYITIQIIKTLLLSYWIIVIQKLVFDYRTYWKSGSKKVSPVQQEFFSYKGIIQPYVKVVRIIALMLLLFWLNETGINQFLIYVLIFSFFFFPIPSFRKVKE